MNPPDVWVGVSASGSFEDSKMCWCLSGRHCAKSAVAIERGLLIERKQDFVGSKASQHPMNED